MIVSSDGRWVVDGGVNPDPDSIWLLDTATDQVHRHHFGDGRWVRLFQGRNDHFAAARYGNDLIELAAYSLEAGVSEPLARIRIEPGGTTMHGDASVWAHVPRAFPGFRPRPLDDPTPSRASAMLVVDRKLGTVEIDDLDWFQKGDYDRDYQVPEEPAELPGSNLLLIPVVRGSRPVLYDPDLHRLVGEVDLASPGRLSRLQFGPQADVIWGWGDGLIHVRPRDGGRLDQDCLLVEGRIQSTVVVAALIADVAFDPAGARGVVGILHSGEVLVLDPQSLNVSLHLETGLVWPSVAILNNGRVFVRDQTTGQVQGIG